MTRGADSRYRLVAYPTSGYEGGVVLGSGSLSEGPKDVLSASIEVASPSARLKGKRVELESRVYYCDNSDACRADNVVFVAPLIGDDGGSPGGATPRLVQKVELPNQP